ncbi:hypothetical protein RJ40_04995 [Methanofollis aquaemaris]|uniref:Uncharacterized protein n=1 Tax=Methanofollis aquaemaris TaxID=126734 RepID=A0A8A3S4A6_9EURY|nr:hypothetical protein [Methanofollis aquaemaris]QSZ66892.1 hypothetical protein RJ40_04995 [Methanofollis aquaemaris]
MEKFLRVLRGAGEPLEIHTEIAAVLADVATFPDRLEPIVAAASALPDPELEHLRFALVRLQVYADIHRYENIEQTQWMKYVAQVLERLIFGSLMVEAESSAAE